MHGPCALGYKNNDEQVMSLDDIMGLFSMWIDFSCVYFIFSYINSNLVCVGFFTGIGFTWDWEAHYTVTGITEGGVADKILCKNDKILQVNDVCEFLYIYIHVHVYVYFINMWLLGWLIFDILSIILWWFMYKYAYYT